MKALMVSIGIALLNLLVFINANAQVAGNAKRGNVYIQQQQLSNNLDYGSFNSYYNNAPEASSRVSTDDRVDLKVSVLMNVIPDSHVAIFNVSQIGETVIEADELLQSRIDGFTKGLESLGIKKEDIYVDMLSFLPIFETVVEKKLFSKTYNEVPKGFELQKNIHVKYTNSNDISGILSVGAKHEIYDLSVVNSYVNNEEALYDTMRRKAITIMNTKVQQFTSLGITLKDEYIVMAEDSKVHFPSNQYQNYQSYISNSLEAKRKKTGVTKANKPQSLYYFPINSSNFDAVINAEILEPVVQYTYHLKVNYISDDEPKNNTKQYFIITEDGRIQNIDIEK